MSDWTLYDWIIFLQLKRRVSPMCMVEDHDHRRSFRFFCVCRSRGGEDFQGSPLPIFICVSGRQALDVQRQYQPRPLWILLGACRRASFVFSLWYRGVLINICPEMCFGTRQELCSLPKAKECAHVWVVLPSAENVGASLSALPSLEFVEFKCDLEEPVGS